MKLKKVLILGSGTMGTGIAQIIAQAGFTVYLYDIEKEIAEKAISRIEKALTRLVEKEKIQEETKKLTLERITGIGDLGVAADSDLVIEAVTENLEAKKALYKKIGESISENAIIATNTSALSITQLASSVKDPSKFIGMHFFNPVPVLKLVEIINGAQTSQETFTKAKNFIESIGQIGIKVDEAPGFVVNRMLVPMINEAAYIFSEGIASLEDIDNAMKLGANHPIGPLALADLVGLDVCLAVMETLYEGFGDSKYRPCPLIRKMVNAGYLGRKTGRGFYEYV